METRTGMKDVGPHTACVLLGLWAEGQMSISLTEFRALVKVVSNFLEELEEVRRGKHLGRYTSGG